MALGWSDIVGSWVAAVFTICVWSFMIKPTLFFKIAETLTVATSIAALSIGSVYSINAYITGEVTVVRVMSFVLGALIVLFLIKRLRFISYWSLAIMVGAGLSLTTMSNTKALLIDQLIATIWPPVEMTPVNMLIQAAGVFGVLAYYLFTFTTRRQMRIIGPLATIGRYMIMAAMGTFIGSLAGYRFNYLIGRVVDIISLFRAPFG